MAADDNDYGWWFLYEGYAEALDKSIVRVEVNGSVTSIPARAFRNCTSLTEITIPLSVISIGSAAFCRCLSLKIINIRNSSVASIGDEAFSDCTSLIEIQLPDSITSIGEHAFMNCRSLAIVRLPKNPNLTIGPCLFHGCHALQKVELPRIALTVWPRLFELFNGDRLFGPSRVGRRTCMFSFMRKNAPQLFEDGRHRRNRSHPARPWRK
jgi:hypothetical protein